MDPVLADVLKIAISGFFGYLGAKAQSHTKADKSDVAAKADRSEVEQLGMQITHLKRFIRDLLGLFDGHHDTVSLALDSHEVLVEGLPLVLRPPFSAWQTDVRVMLRAYRAEIYRLDNEKLWGEPPVAPAAPVAKA